MCPHHLWLGIRADLFTYLNACCVSSIAVDELVLKYRYVSLLLEGMDTVADVMLNDVFLVTTRNMFQRSVINVTDTIKVYLRWFF